MTATHAPTHRAASGVSASGGTSPLAGFGSQLRLDLRLARASLIAWPLAMLALVPASVLAMEEAYPDEAALESRALLLGNPSAVMMTGPAFGTDHYTFWAMVANELALYLYLAAAIMSVLLAVRFTRGEEESGRLELVRALPVGRLAPSLAALALVAIANAAVGAAIAVGLLASGGALADSLAMGSAAAATGLVLGAVAAVWAQLTEHAGAASGGALAVLAVAFMVRGIGDVIDNQGSWLSWLSPLAWAQQTRVFVDLRWWPLGVSMGAVLVLLAVAALLARRRDLGAGLRPARAGRADARAALLTVPGLVQRLVGGGMIAWTVGLFVFAIAFGSLAASLEDMADDIPAVSDWVAIDLDDLTGSFAAVMLSFLALGPAGLAVMATARLRTEEQEGRLAGVLLGGSSRTGLAAGWFAVVLGQVAIVQVLLGVGLGIGVGQATDDGGWVGELTVASLAYLPAAAAFAGATLLLYALRPRLAGLGWVLFGWAAIVTFLGGMLQLPDWASGFSPIHHVPLVPDADWDAAPLLVLGALAVAFAIIGLVALRRRDLVAG